MAVRYDITGQRFGRLTAIVHQEHGNWLCMCDCGNQTVKNQYPLRIGRVRSCGCLHREASSTRSFKHGLSRSKTHMIWQAMHQRCRNPRAKGYNNYGGRGITVCDRWKDFANFYTDMGECPPGFSIERLNVNGHYEPSNCAWIPRNEQSLNRRDNIMVRLATPKILDLRRQGLSQSRIEEMTGIKQSVISRVLKRAGFPQARRPKYSQTRKFKADRLPTRAEATT